MRDERGEKVLPDASRTPWVAAFVAVLAATAQKPNPIAFDPEKNYAGAADPNKKHRLLVLPLLLLQTLLLRPLLVRQIRKDIKGGVGGRVWTFGRSRPDERPRSFRESFETGRVDRREVVCVTTRIRRHARAFPGVKHDNACQ